MTETVDRGFFRRAALEVAPDLLGMLVRHGPVAIRITEVEAYEGRADPGSHAYRGPTPRSAVMFGPPGHLYVYRSYGLHWCANLVCGEEGQAAAVLLRAGEVVAGEDEARMRRYAGRSEPAPAHQLARGPANLASALGLTGALDGLDLFPGEGPAAPVSVVPGRDAPASVRWGPRVGVSGPGGDGQVYPWRAWVPGDPTVSAYRPAARRAPRGAGAPRTRG